MGNLGIPGRSLLPRRSSEGMKLSTMFIMGAIFGLLLGISFSFFVVSKLGMPTGIFSYVSDENTVTYDQQWTTVRNQNIESLSHCHNKSLENHVLAKSRGAERLPPGIVVAESDLFLRRLWGEPSEDLPKRQKYLVTFTVGFEQRYNIDAAIKKFSDNFTILLFHYDGRVSEWDEFEWAKQVIHVSARKQTKWWFAKRFLHPDIVASYEYIFIWDEDLGVDHFNAEEYIRLAKKHRLKISQPGLQPYEGLTWKMTERRPNSEVHKETTDKPGYCKDPHSPPCAGFVEIMATVFSRDAWRCAWHLIQNDLVHGWGIDFALGKCVESPHEEIGVVDAQWIIHQGVPSLGNQGLAENGKEPWMGVRERCRREWGIFRDRLEAAEAACHGILTPSLNSTHR